jgi:hypothetical protein
MGIPLIEYPLLFVPLRLFLIGFDLMNKNENVKVVDQII